MKCIKIILSGGLYVFLSLFLSQENTAQTKKEKPNIICILTDDLGYSDLGSFGAKDIRTPNIDKLMSSGIKMTNFYSNSPVCSPTRASLITGKYPDLAGVPGVIRINAFDNWGYLRPEVKTLPEVLKKGSYKTALIGKWHLGLEEPNLPNQRGFDYFYGFLEGTVDDNYTHLREGQNFFRLNKEIINPQGHPTDIFTNEAIKYFEKQKNSKEPFFLYLAYTAPHMPLQPPVKYMDIVTKREPGIEEQRMRMAATVEHLDASIGKLLEAIKADGLYDNTLIVFTNDNGGQLSASATNNPWKGGKEDMYEGGIKVPFGVSWPGKIKSQTDSTTIALTMDLFTTFCDIANVTPPKSINGISLLNVWINKTVLPERDLVWMRREGNSQYEGQDYYAIRIGDWKLLHNNPFKTYELYNLKDDPSETNNLAAINVDKYKELTTALRKHIQKAGSVPWQKDIKQ